MIQSTLKNTITHGMRQLFGVNNYHVLPVLIILLCVVLTCPLTFGLKTDSSKPMDISADTVDVLYKMKKTILTGNAVITQGSTELSADKIIIYYDKNNKFEKMFAYGTKDKQAEYHTTLDKNNSPFTATADIIQYFDQQNLAKFLHNARANDGTNNFAGDELEYWSEKGEVLTKGSKTKKVQITIMPNSLKQKENLKTEQS